MSMKMQVQFLASLSGLRIHHYHELWCRSQMRPRFGLAVAPNQPLAQELPCAAGAALKIKANKEKTIILSKMKTMFFFFFKNCSIDDLQCCANLFCTVKWFSHTNIYIPFLIFHHGLSSEIPCAIQLDLVV